MLSVIINSTDFNNTKKLIESIYEFSCVGNLEIIVSATKIPNKSFCDWIDYKYKELSWIISVCNLNTLSVSERLLQTAKLAEGAYLWFLSDDFVFTPQNLDLLNVIKYNQIGRKETPHGLWSSEIRTESAWPQVVISKNLYKCLLEWDCKDFYWFASYLYHYPTSVIGLRSEKNKRRWFSKTIEPVIPNYLTYLDTEYYSELIQREVKECQRLVRNCVVNQLACQ